MDLFDLDQKSSEYGTMTLKPDVGNPTNFTIVPLPVEIRDSVLGRVMGAWGVLEGVIGVILQLLIKTDFEAALIITASGLTTVEIKDLIIALSRLRLNENNQKIIENLGEKLKRKNTKRNRIVHGEWRTEVVNQSVPLGHPPSMIERWVRFYTPTDPIVAKKARDPSNQKERSAYRFTLHQMLKVEAEINQLVAEFSAFNEIIYPLLVLPPASSTPNP